MAEHAFSYAEHLRPAFLAHMADRLDARICAQTAEMLSRAGALTPVKSVSAMIYLLKKGRASLADIADADRQSHQLVSSRVAPLEALGLVARADDPKDARRKVLRLTPKGQADAKIVENVCTQISRALDDLCREIGHDLTAALEKAERDLARETIAERAERLSVAAA